jgi:hypothetical protein
MRDRVGLVTNKVIKAICRVGVNKAVSNPLTCSDRFVDVGDDLKSRLNSVFIGFASIQPIDVVLLRKPQNVK